MLRLDQQSQYKKDEEEEEKPLIWKNLRPNLQQFHGNTNFTNAQLYGFLNDSNDGNVEIHNVLTLARLITVYKDEQYEQQNPRETRQNIKYMLIISSFFCLITQKLRNKMTDNLVIYIFGFFFDKIKTDANLTLYYNYVRQLEGYAFKLSTLPSYRIQDEIKISKMILLRFFSFLNGLLNSPAIDSAQQKLLRQNIKQCFQLMIKSDKFTRFYEAMILIRIQFEGMYFRDFAHKTERHKLRIQRKQQILQPMFTLKGILRQFIKCVNSAVSIKLMQILIGAITNIFLKQSYDDRNQIYNLLFYPLMEKIIQIYREQKLLYKLEFVKGFFYNNYISDLEVAVIVDAQHNTQIQTQYDLKPLEYIQMIRHYIQKTIEQHIEILDGRLNGNQEINREQQGQMPEVLIKTKVKPTSYQMFCTYVEHLNHSYQASKFVKQFEKSSIKFQNFSEMPECQSYELNAKFSDIKLSKQYLAYLYKSQALLRSASQPNQRKNKKSQCIKSIKVQLNQFMAKAIKVLNMEIDIFPHSDSIIVIGLKTYVVQKFCNEARVQFYGKGYLAHSSEIPYQQIIIRQLVNDFKSNDPKVIWQRITTYQSDRLHVWGLIFFYIFQLRNYNTNFKNNYQKILFSKMSLKQINDLLRMYIYDLKFEQISFGQLYSDFVQVLEQKIEMGLKTNLFTDKMNQPMNDIQILEAHKMFHQLSTSINHFVIMIQSNDNEHYNTTHKMVYCRTCMALDPRNWVEEFIRSTCLFCQYGVLDRFQNHSLQINTHVTKRKIHLKSLISNKIKELQKALKQLTLFGHAWLAYLKRTNNLLNGMSNFGDDLRGYKQIIQQ